MALSFLFGGDTQETPESIKRKRDIARALLASRAPQNVGEGISALGDGIVSAVLNSRADKAEKIGMESASNDFAPLVSGFGGSSAALGATGSSMPKVGAAGNVALPSSGGDLPSSFLTAVDKTEGAGGYDTLYGNAQKGGAFAGTNVSGMPIRDVLAFTDPNGAYAQSVKSKIGRVATPVGRYQVVGTTLRGAVNDLGLDPNAPFDQGTQDKIAAHLARQRIASADTPGGKIAALRAEWHGFRNVPDAQMAQIVNDLENGRTPSATAPPTEVASLDPSAGMPPVSPIQPPVTPPPAAPVPGYVDPRVTTEGSAPAPLPAPAQAPQPSPAVAQALMAPQKGGRLGTPPQPLPDAEFNARFGADDTGAIPPQVGPQSTLPPLPVTEVGPTPNVASVPFVGNEQGSGKQPVTVAQALINGDRSNVGMGGDAPGAGYFPAAPNAGGQSGPSQEQILKVLTNPYASDSQKAVANALLKRSMDASDPDSQLDREYKRAQLDALKAKPQKAWQKLTDTLLFNPETGETKDITGTPAGEKPKFRYQGNSVEAQSLNGLMDAGTITPDQAQQLGAGKTITGPNGEIIFMTPQGVFGKPSNGPAQPMSAPQVPTQQPPVDLFGDGGAGAPTVSPPTPAAVPAPSAVPPAPAATSGGPEPRPGMIPLTGKKPDKPLTENERKNQSLFSVIKPELAVVEDNFNALTDPKNQVFSKMPFSEFVTTPQYQKAANSLQTIVSSYLYSVSGATATPDEVKKQTDILTPRPGESKESIESKKKRVRTMVNAVAASGGLPPLDEPVEPPLGDDLSNMPAPEGMEENVWKFVSPEERRLWLKK